MLAMILPCPGRAAAAATLSASTFGIPLYRSLSFAPFLFQRFPPKIVHPVNKC